MGFWDTIGQGVDWLSGSGQYSPGYDDYQALGKQGQQEAGWGELGMENANSNNAKINQTQVGLQNAINYQNDLATGKNSVSAEQLRGSLQQQLAQQQAMSAASSPANSAMAARNAAMNMGNASYGMAGQQAMAGLQERNQAALQMGQMSSQLGQMQNQQTANYLQMGNTGYQQANNSYGNALQKPPAASGPGAGGAIGGLLAMI